MKKTAALFLVLAAAITLAACGKVEPEMPTESVLEETVSLTETASAQPEMSRIEINMNNWREYFELKTLDRWGDNGYGEHTALTQLAGLWVREEYQDRIINEGDIDLTCALSYDRVERKIDVDFTNRVYTWGEAVSTEAGCRVSERINFFAGYPDGLLMAYGTGNTVEKGNDTLVRNENMALTHIEGTIWLLAG